MTTAMSSPLDVDFLPASYRQIGRQRSVRAWRILVCVTLATALGLAAWFQHCLCRATEQELVAVERQHAAAVAWNDELARVRADLATARSDAELLTFLRHPWPRSGIVNAAVAALPESVSLKELHITHTGPAHAAVSEERGPQGSGKQAAQLPAAARDLERLRVENAGWQTIVNLTGEAAEPSALHDYLAALGRQRLFAKVELGSIETGTGTGDQAKTAKFTARLILTRTSRDEPSAPPPPGQSHPGQVAAQGAAR